MQMKFHNEISEKKKKIFEIKRYFGNRTKTMVKMN